MPSYSPSDTLPCPPLSPRMCWAGSACSAGWRILQPAQEEFVAEELVAEEFVAEEFAAEEFLPSIVTRRVLSRPRPQILGPMAGRALSYMCE
mmetsp:Transcript_27283/g.71938  ORF Transcript_27283/g.71938 Transcript_27283/m.71938 type:complete len:92 (+) Transcript_27283:58-333(+)